MDMFEQYLDEFDNSVKRKLIVYCNELERWNKKLNLTSLKGEALVRRLVLEPCWIARKLEIKGVMWDIGSGNGSPAIPIGLSSRVEALHLIEARSKRAAFLRHVTATLDMKEAQVHRARFEEVAGKIGTPDWITMQAVEPSESILNAIKEAGLVKVRVVWITSRRKMSLVAASSVLELPDSDTIAVDLALDQS